MVFSTAASVAVPAAPCRVLVGCFGEVESSLAGCCCQTPACVLRGSGKVERV
jgi:hypothetical protein